MFQFPYFQSSGYSHRQHHQRKYTYEQSRIRDLTLKENQGHSELYSALLNVITLLYSILLR